MKSIFKSHPECRNKRHNAPDAGLAPFLGVGCLVHFRRELDKLTRNRELRNNSTLVESRAGVQARNSLSRFKDSTVGIIGRLKFRPKRVS